MRGAFVWNPAWALNSQLPASILSISIIHHRFPANPEKNSLSTGVNEAELIRAIDMSGYPLQGVVAGKLKEHFTVSEEWGYLDRDTKEHRSLDLHAFRQLDAAPDADSAGWLRCY